MRGLNTEKAVIVITAFTGLIFAVVIVGTVLEIFDDPESKTSTVIEGYQTYFGGVLALVAAMITVGGVYAAATLPMRAENARIAEQRLKNQEIGAAIIFAEVTGVKAQLMVQTLHFEENGSDPDWVFPGISIPEHLRNFETIATQPPSMATDVARFMSLLAQLNGFTKVHIEGDRDVVYRLIQTATTDGTALEDRLKTDIISEG